MALPGKGQFRDAPMTTHEPYCKLDVYTAKRVIADAADKFGFSAPARNIQSHSSDTHLDRFVLRIEYRGLYWFNQIHR
jgi:hypothetical protein